MRSYYLEVRDGKERIFPREVDIPVPRERQVLVKIHASALNRGELVSGAGPHGSLLAAKAIGMEACGEIIALGEQVSHFKLGDPVTGRCAAAFSDFGLMTELEAMPLPKSLSWVQGAAIPITVMVSHDMLVSQGNLQPGQWVLISGVSSGVGVSCLQLAKAIGAKVIGTSGSARKLDLLKAHGLDAGIFTREGNFYEEVMSLTSGKGASLIINAVGGSLLPEQIRSAAFQGKIAIVGYVDGILNACIDIETIHAKRLHIFGVSNKFRTPDQRANSIAEFIKDFLPLFAEGKILPVIDKVYPLTSIEEAIGYIKENQHVGKVVLDHQIK
jgi:NADPH:quinone reductase